MSYFWLKGGWQAIVVVVINPKITQVTKNYVQWGLGG